MVVVKLAKKGGMGPQGTGQGSKPVLTLVISSAVSDVHGMADDFVTDDVPRLDPCWSSTRDHAGCRRQGQNACRD